ncbi:hypothetical protein MNBD_PLANCTO02-546 [hydrothermal vent metagenome]|uniref:Uncharacterized protein n=1 Tax=hydrothermal vent metagenome TaxID=652676 RepID=A0A3B1DZJ2_9ZZZZ
MNTFYELAVSRRNWIDEVLAPWCQTVTRKELLKAEMEWLDIAGKVDETATLWTWAWSRFPELVYDGLAGVNETREVCVTLKDGNKVVGFPDGRRTEKGMLYLVTSDSTTPEAGPFSIDDIKHVKHKEDDR